MENADLPKFYCAWYCPYAQRAWIALLAKKVEFDYIEHNSYNKIPEWKSISPTGLVPVIIHKGKTIYESAVCIEYVDEAFNTDVSLLPKDPYQRAYARIWGDFLSKKVASNFHQMLTKPSEKERQEARDKMLEALHKITDAMSPDHVFFQGDDIGYVDIMFAPIGIRWEIFKDISELHLPDLPDTKRFKTWWEAVKNHPAVTGTLQDPQKLLEHFKRLIKENLEAVAADQ